MNKKVQKVVFNHFNRHSSNQRISSFFKYRSKARERIKKSNTDIANSNDLTNNNINAHERTEDIANLNKTNGAIANSNELKIDTTMNIVSEGVNQVMTTNTNKDIEQVIKDPFINIDKLDGTFQITAIGCGNAGGQNVDILATKRDSNNNPLYECLAINSNDGDLKVLKNISTKNKISLDIGGMGKNPIKGYETLEKDKKVREIMNNFILERMKPVHKEKKNLLLLFAALGGGTGAATVLKIAEEFIANHNDTKLKQNKFIEILKKKNLDINGYKNLKSEEQKIIQNIVNEEVEKLSTKIGIIVYLPDKHIGKEQIEYVSEFSQKLWEIAKPKFDEEGNVKPNQIAFITFPDNQKFLDVFNNELTEEERSKYGNALNYANHVVTSTFHEINTIPKASQEKANLDAADLSNLLLEKSGYLVISKHSSPIANITSSEDIVNMFLKGFTENHLHSDIELFNDGEKKHQVRIMDVGINVVIDDSVSNNKMMSQYGDGKFIVDARERLNMELANSGTVYDGFIQKPNGGNISTYTIFKTDTLPVRLTKGLAEEYKELVNRIKATDFAKTSTIATLGNKKNTQNEEDDFLKSIGMDDSSETTNSNSSTNKDEFEDLIAEIESDNQNTEPTKSLSFEDEIRKLLND